MSDNVVIKSGETIRFPLAPENDLAARQEQLEISQVADLRELAIVRTLTKANPSLSADQIAEHVKNILASYGVNYILHLNFADTDLTVEEGATLEIGGPISTLTARNIVLLGDIAARGSLNISCTSLGKIKTPVITNIVPKSGSSLGGDTVVIEGSGLSNITSVKFGDTPSEHVSSFDDTRIEAVAPRASLGSVHISVTAYETLGSAPSATDLYTYVFAPRVVGLSTNADVLWAGSTVTGAITLDEPAAAGGVAVALTLAGAPGVTLPQAISVPAGATSTTFPINVPATAAEGVATLSATGPDGNIKSLSIGVSPGQVFALINSSTPAPPPEIGLQSGRPVSIAIYVRTPAPPGGGEIALGATLQHASAAGLPTHLALGAGASSADFTVTPVAETFPGGSVTISATYQGNTATIVLKIPVPMPHPPPGGGNPL